jgi:hypothetical protein
MIKLFNFLLEKAKSGLYYILYNIYTFIAVFFFLAFFIFIDLICTRYFYIEILLFAAGILFTHIQLKINPDLLIDEIDWEQEQAEIEEKRKCRATAVLDWNITYEWAVLLGEDKK